MRIEWKYVNAAPDGTETSPGEHPVIIESAVAEPGDIFESEPTVVVTVRFLETDIRENGEARVALAQLLEGYRRTRGISRVVTRSTTRIALEITEEQRAELREWLSELTVVAEVAAGGISSTVTTRSGDVLPEAVFTLLREVAK